MSIEHLRMLRKALEDSHWVVLEEFPGNNYEMSGIWKVGRPNGDSPISLAFEGLDDLDTLPIEKAYACHMVGNNEIALYFGKVGKSFPTELPVFIEALSRVHT